MAFNVCFFVKDEEIKKALTGINGLATGVDKQLNAVKSSFGTAYNVAFNATSKLKGVIIALAGGLITGFKFFSKRKKCDIILRYNIKIHAKINKAKIY